MTSRKISVLLGVVTGDNRVTSDDKMYELRYDYEYSYKINKIEFINTLPYQANACGSE